MDTILVAPSILSADWGRLDEEIAEVVSAGADWIHLDVMDGHFVPPITFGARVVEVVRKATSLPLDVHLMVSNPENHIDSFAKAGADILSVHVETCPHLHRLIERIQELGCKAGVVLNPSTPVDWLSAIISNVDLVLLMTVNPGWGGQKFISGSEKKISQTRTLITSTGRQIHLEVDGGVDCRTVSDVVRAGADVLVAGSYVFGHKDYAEAIRLLKAPAK